MMKQDHHPYLVSPSNGRRGYGGAQMPVKTFLRRIAPANSRLVLALVIAGLLCASCARGRSDAPQNQPAESGAASAGKETTSEQAPDFDLTAAWTLRKVTLKKPPEAVATGPQFNYDLTVKPDQQFIALELSLKQEQKKEPIFSTEAVLIDSSGERHKSLFAYPAALATYKPYEETIVFLDDWNQANKKVSELGGKVVAVFSVPKGKEVVKVEIGGATPLPVALPNVPSSGSASPGRR